MDSGVGRPREGLLVVLGIGFGLGKPAKKGEITGSFALCYVWMSSKSASGVNMKVYY